MYRYEVLEGAKDDLHRPYTALASLLNCSSDEIAIVTSATEAWQQVLYGLAASWPLKSTTTPTILTSLTEYGSNYIAYLQLQKRYGVSIEILSETPTGDLCLPSLAQRLQENTTNNTATSSNSQIVLVSLNHVPTSSGKVYDVEGVGALTSHYNIPFLLDACQSVGQMPVDVRKIKCDFLSGTGRKYLRAPRGSGFLYCSQKALNFEKVVFEPATLDNTGAVWASRDGYELQPIARRFERYEMSFAAKVGLGVAVEQCNDIGIDRIWSRIQFLSSLLRRKLAEMVDVEVHDRGTQLCGLVTFTKKGLTADEVQQRLFEKKINVSVSRVMSSRLDFEERGLVAVVRASVHYYNTEEELEQLVVEVEKL